MKPTGDYIVSLSASFAVADNVKLFQPESIPKTAALIEPSTVTSHHSLSTPRQSRSPNHHIPVEQLSQYCRSDSSDSSLDQEM